MTYQLICKNISIVYRGSVIKIAGFSMANYSIDNKNQHQYDNGYWDIVSIQHIKGNFCGQ